MNVGKIIKVLSIILFFITMIVLMYLCTKIWENLKYDNILLYFGVYTVAAIFVSGIVSILMYGFGDLIDTNKQILKKLRK